MHIHDAHGFTLLVIGRAGEECAIESHRQSQNRCEPQAQASGGRRCARNGSGLAKICMALSLVHPVSSKIGPQCRSRAPGLQPPRLTSVMAAKTSSELELPEGPSFRQCCRKAKHQNRNIERQDQQGTSKPPRLSPAVTAPPIDASSDRDKRAQ